MKVQHNLLGICRLFFNSFFICILVWDPCVRTGLFCLCVIVVVVIFCLCVIVVVGILFNYYILYWLKSKLNYCYYWYYLCDHENTFKIKKKISKEKFRKVETDSYFI